MIHLYVSVYHSVQTKARLDVLGMGKIKKKQVKPITDEQALDLGLDILGDTVIIGCALVIYLVFESRPSGSKGPDKADVMQNQEIKNLKVTVQEQELTMAHLSAELRELERLIHSKTMYSEVSDKIMEEYKKLEKLKKS